MSNDGTDRSGEQEVTFVSQVVGTGADARRLVKVGPWDMAAFVEHDAEEPRVSIAALAARVGQPAYELRRTARGIKSEKFNPLTAWTPPMPGEHSGFDELHLTEAEALFLVTRLRTPRAEEVTWEMIRVYRLARRGLLPQQRATLPMELVAMMREQTELIVRSQAEVMAGMASRIERLESATALNVLATRMDRLEQHIVNDTGVVGEAWSDRHVLARLRRIANVAVGAPAGIPLCKEARAYHRRINNKLRADMEFNGRGSAWKNLPRGEKVRLLEQRLEALEIEAAALGKGKSDPRQKNLFS
jgi:hypothetical protein